jgi:hypothetical protein
MKGTGHIQKWGVGALGAVALVLLVHLALQLNRQHRGETRPGAKTPPSTKASAVPGAKGAAGNQKISDELSRYDPVVKQDLLKEFEDRPLPELRRNPFEFVGGPTEASPVQAAVQAAAPQPPPPPPVTLKLMGYSEGKGGVKEAMVSDEDQIFVVHEGDSVGTRYKIIKITPTMVTVQDATLHQNVDLPVPQ